MKVIVTCSPVHPSGNAHSGFLFLPGQLSQATGPGVCGISCANYPKPLETDEVADISDLIHNLNALLGYFMAVDQPKAMNTVWWAEQMIKDLVANLPDEDSYFIRGELTDEAPEM